MIKVDLWLLVILNNNNNPLTLIGIIEYNAKVIQGKKPHSTLELLKFILKLLILLDMRGGDSWLLIISLLKIFFYFLQRFALCFRKKHENKYCSKNADQRKQPIKIINLKLLTVKIINLPVDSRIFNICRDCDIVLQNQEQKEDIEEWHCRATNIFRPKQWFHFI